MFDQQPLTLFNCPSQYISSENRCARCYVPRINHDHRIHPQKKTRGQRGTNNNIIRSYEFLEMSFPPPPPPKKKKRRRRCPNARRTEHGQVINNATPREGEGETETEPNMAFYYCLSRDSVVFRLFLSSPSWGKQHL